MTSDDIIFILTALLRSTAFDAPTSFNKIADELKEAKEASGTTLTAMRSRAEWEKWRTRITSCAAANSMTDAETSGHWVLTSTLMSSEPQATIWEPLKSRPERVETAFIEACGPCSVITQVTGVQKDGWRCGYICLYWFLFQYKLLQDSVLLEPSVLGAPPPAWENVLWLLLKVRDTQVGSTEKSAMDLSLESALTKAWEKPSYDFVAEATRILEVVASSCVFMHFAHMHCL